MADTIEKEAKFLSGYVYHNEKYTKNYGYQFLKKSEDFGNGFYAESYFKNGRIYIVYKGTDHLKKSPINASKDLRSDLSMAAKIEPGQTKNARLFYDYIARQYRNYPIYATGHSLGGSLAQIIGSSTKEVKAITFNAYGTGQIKGINSKYPENVTNYGNAKDFIFKSNIDNHVGKVYVVDENSHNENTGFKYHPVEYLGNIDTAKEYKSQRHEKSNVLVNSYSQNPKIQKVHKMFQKHEEKLKNKKSSGAKRSTSSGGNGRWVTMNERHVYLEN